MRRGEDNKINHILLRESILQSIIYLQSKVYIQEKEVYELVKAFFKEYLGLDYEFTHEELIIELQNIFYDKSLEDKVLKFLRTINRIEYSDEEFSAKELKDILEEFSYIVDLLIKNKNNKKSFLRKLIFWKEYKDEIIPVEKLEQEEIVDNVEDLEKNISLDRKKGLFSKKDKLKKYHRIIKEKKKKLNNIKKKKSKHKENNSNIDKKTSLPLNSSLLQVTDELNSRLAEEREKKHDKISITNNSVNSLTKTPEKKIKFSKLLKQMKKNPSKENYSILKTAYNNLSEKQKKKYYKLVDNSYKLIKSTLSSEKNS